jgi:ribokinase
MVVGQIARDIVLQVDSIPAAGSAAPATQRLEMLGGKGANQALGLVQLGLRVSLLSAVGDDPAGEWLLGHAAADGIDTTWVARRPGAESGLIVSAVGPDGWRYVESLPAQVLVSPGDVALAEPAIRKADTMVIQLQQPGAAALAAAQAGRRAGARVVLDGAPEAGFQRPLLRAADVVRADGREAELLTGQPVRSGRDAVAAGRELLRHGPSLVALAAGHDGNAIVWPGGSVVLPLTGGPQVDTIGAGDAFIAALVAALARGAGAADAGRQTVAAVGRTVAHLGGRPDLRSRGQDTDR